MEQIYYLTLDEAVKIHRATIEKSGGGDIGDLDLGRLVHRLFNKYPIYNH